MDKEKWSEWFLNAKIRLMGLGAVGVFLWFLVKWIACTFFGVCIL